MSEVRSPTAMWGATRAKKVRSAGVNIATAFSPRSRAEHAPARPVNHEGGAQLIAQRDRLQDFAIAPACGQVTAGALVETPGVVRASGQLDELVGVILQELVRRNNGV